MLLTDGEDNDSEAGALEAAQNAAKDGLKIFTIGIGTAAGDLIRVTDANGNSDYVRDEQGNVVKSHLNEALLQQIAAATGGFYLPLRGANTMDTLYERGLAPLPKSEGEEKLIRRYHEQFQWPLAAAILLLLAEMFLPERKREKSKIQSPTSKAGTAAVAALAIAVWRSAGFACRLAGGARCAITTRAITPTRSRNFERLAQVHTNDLRAGFQRGRGGVSRDEL